MAACISLKVEGVSLEIGGFTATAVPALKSVTAAVVAIAAVVVVIATIAETPDAVAVVIVPCPAKGIRTGGGGGVAGEVKYGARDPAEREDVCGI